jgi:hypothetical protein
MELDKREIRYINDYVSANAGAVNSPDSDNKDTTRNAQKRKDFLLLVWHSIYIKFPPPPKKKFVVTEETRFWRPIDLSLFLWALPGRHQNSYYGSTCELSIELATVVKE